jgi:undecaprenyl-diphosphatase
MNWLDATILGIVEGLTEFLPVSSTGHLILTSYLLGLKQTAFLKTFEVAIQLGSIMAITFIYWQKLLKDFQLWIKVIIAFIPTGILGLIFYKFIKSYLFSPLVVASSLIIGGIIFLLVEYWEKNRKPSINNLKEIDLKRAFLIGIFQSLAMIPGTSRSGATIIGGLLLGFNRQTAVEFSFLLAIPTMLIATSYDIFKHYHEFSLQNWYLLFIGFMVSFITAFFVVKWFLSYIKNHTFIPFGIYRIILGLIFFLIFITTA